MGRAAHLPAAPDPCALTPGAPVGRLGRVVPVRARSLVAAALAALVLPAGAGAAQGELVPRLDRALAVPHVSSAASAAFAVDLATGEAIYSHNASLPLLPA